MSCIHRARSNQLREEVDRLAHELDTTRAGYDSAELWANRYKAELASVRAERDKAYAAGLEQGLAEGRSEAPRLLGLLLDMIVYENPVSAADWDEACLLGGRYTTPWREWEATNRKVRTALASVLMRTTHDPGQGEEGGGVP
jgi:hypothetical protein